MADFYKIGDHNVICDICGKKRKASQCRMQWDNLLVCSVGCWSPKHANENPIPIINDGYPVHNARPRATLSFIPDSDTTGVNTWENQSLLISETDGHILHTTNSTLTWANADVLWKNT